MLAGADLNIIHGMKKKRLLLLVGAIAAVVGVTLGVLAMLPPKPGITKENFDRIENGMAFEDVNAIFGQQPDPWQSGVRANGWKQHLWKSNDGDFAIIAFDENGAVEKHWLGQRDDRTAFEKLLDRLPWREKPRRVRLWD